MVVCEGIPAFAGMTKRKEEWRGKGNDGGKEERRKKEAVSSKLDIQYFYWTYPKTSKSAGSDYKPGASL